MRRPADVLSPRDEFDSERLTLAREFRGLRKVELADAAGLSPAAISQYEAGEMSPKPEALARLAFALGVPLPFLRPHGLVPRIEEHEVHFRRLRSSRTVDRRRVLARTKLLVEVAAALQSYVELPPATLPRTFGLADEAERSPARIEAIAAAVRAEWSLGLGPLSHTVRLLESKGVFVTRLRSETEDLDAFSLWVGVRPFIVLSSDKEDAGRSRFDAMHELGHLLLHPDDPNPTDRAREIEAQLFASAFLMPRESIARELPPTLDWDAYLVLKSRWKVSMQALLRRSRDIGRITNAHYRRAVTILSSRDWRRHEPGSAGPIEEPHVLPTALQIALEENATPELLAEALHLGTDDFLSILRDGGQEGESAA